MPGRSLCVVVGTILSRLPNVSSLPDLTLPSAVQQSGTAEAIGASSLRLAPLVEETTTNVPLPASVGLHTCACALVHVFVLILKEYYSKKWSATCVVATGVSNQISPFDNPGLSFAAGGSVSDNQKVPWLSGTQPNNIFWFCQWCRSSARLCFFLRSEAALTNRGKIVTMRKCLLH